MTIENIFTFFEKNWHTLTNEEKYQHFDKLDKYINDPEFDLGSIFESESRFKRVFFVTFAHQNTLQRVLEQKIVDKRYTVKFIHLLLIKASIINERFQGCFSKDYSPHYLELIKKIIEQQIKAVERPGSTLSFALGFFIGQGIVLGSDMTSILPICKSPFVIDKEELIIGFKNAFTYKDSFNLTSSSSYLQDLKERYMVHWETTSMKICFDTIKLYSSYYQHKNIDINHSNAQKKVVGNHLLLLDNIGNIIEKDHVEKRFAVRYLQENEKALWYLYGMTSHSVLFNIISSFEQYRQNTSKEVVKEVIEDVPVSPTYTAIKELSQLVDKMEQQLSQEIVLTQDYKEKIIHKHKI